MITYQYKKYCLSCQFSPVKDNGERGYLDKERWLTSPSCCIIFNSSDTRRCSRIFPFLMYPTLISPYFETFTRERGTKK